MCVTMLFRDTGRVQYLCVGEEVRIAFGGYVLVIWWDWKRRMHRTRYW